MSKIFACLLIFVGAWQLGQTAPGWARLYQQWQTSQPHLTYEGYPELGSQALSTDLTIEEASSIAAQEIADAFIADEASEISDTDLDYKINLQG